MRWCISFGLLWLALLASTVLGPRASSAQVAPGLYLYSNVPVSDLRTSAAVAFHPDGHYAVILESTNRVQILDWTTRTAVVHDLTPASGSIQWDELLFDASGDFALLVGTELGATSEGVVFRLDDALYRSGGTTAQIFGELTALRVAGRHTGIARPWSGGLPVLLTRDVAGTIATLREIDTTTGTFGPLVTSINSGAGCDDVAFANNEFGDPGLLVVCGVSGADVLFYTEVGGVPEWRTGLGDPGTGNTSSVAARPGGDYALVVSFSARRVLRFADGLLSASGSSPSFPTKGIVDVAFAPSGERALIVGRAGGAPLSAPILEYRDDLFSAAEITDVSIAGFDGLPWSGTSTTTLFASAWRPGCDGGLIVGGQTGFLETTGLLIEFGLDGGASCDAAPVPGLLGPWSLPLIGALAVLAHRSLRGAGTRRPLRD